MRLLYKRETTVGTFVRHYIATKHPRLQVLTIEELLAGKRIDMPRAQDIRSFRQAPKAKGRKKEQAKLFGAEGG